MDKSLPQYRYFKMLQLHIVSCALHCDDTRPTQHGSPNIVTLRFFSLLYFTAAPFTSVACNCLRAPHAACYCNSTCYARNFCENVGLDDADADDVAHCALCKAMRPHARASGAWCAGAADALTT